MAGDKFYISQYTSHTGVSIANGGGVSGDFDFDNSDLSDVHVNGGPVSDAGAWNGSKTACTWTAGGDGMIITKTGAFVDVTDYTYAHVIGLDASANEYDIWCVARKTSDNTITVDCSATVDSGTTCDVKVGGLFAGLTDPETNGVLDAGDENRVVEATYTLDSTVPITSAGTATARFYTTGVNSDGEKDGSIATITTDTVLADGLMEFGADGDYHTFENIELDGNGKAAYCLATDSTASANYNAFINCNLHNSTSHVIHWYGSSTQFILCDIHGSTGGAGIDCFYGGGGSGSSFVKCKIYDNSTYGFNMAGTLDIISCQIYGNGNDGIQTSNLSDGSLIINNTIYGNAGDGIDIVVNCGRLVVLSNTCANNTGYGYNLNSDISFNVFKQNHSYNNTGGHCSETSSDAEFQDFGSGSNIVGDPKFVSAATNDFSLKSTSPLLLDDSIIGAVGLTDIPLLSAVLDTATLGGEDGTASGGGGGGGFVQGSSGRFGVMEL